MGGVNLPQMQALYIKLSVYRDREYIHSYVMFKKCCFTWIIWAPDKIHEILSQNLPLFCGLLETSQYLVFGLILVKYYGAIIICLLYGWFFKIQTSTSMHPSPLIQYTIVIDAHTKAQATHKHKTREILMGHFWIYYHNWFTFHG